MGRKVTAICEKQIFDNDNGILYYPGDSGEIDLDTDVALSFKLTPEDRKYALVATKERIRTREDEKQKAKERGFSSIYEMRRYDEEFGEGALPQHPQVVESLEAEKLKTVVKGAKKGDAALEQMGL